MVEAVVLDTAQERVVEAAHTNLAARIGDGWSDDK